jgi:hypothetical protein
MNKLLLLIKFFNDSIILVFNFFILFGNIILDMLFLDE